MFHSAYIQLLRCFSLEMFLMYQNIDMNKMFLLFIYMAWKYKVYIQSSFTYVFFVCIIYFTFGFKTWQ